MAAAASPRRKQVKAFQFLHGRPSSTPIAIESDEKENHSSPPPGAKTAPQLPSQTSPSKFPSTPASRPPLADLIGDADDNAIHLHQAAPHPPGDQLQWNAVRSPRSNSSAITPAPGARKRARSTSPPSASQSASKRLKSAVDPERPNQALRTPAIDPTADLWARYNLPAERDSGLSNPLASLLNSSSPYSDGNVGGLRRWTSCGVEWPSSKRKRQLAQPPQKRDRFDVFADFQDDAAVEDPGKNNGRPSKMGSLLERIQESLAQANQAKTEQDGPSSSSPLPDRTEHFDRQSISPCRGPELAAQREDQSPTHSRTRSNGSRGTQSIVQHPPSAASESFGSDSTEMALVAETLAIDQPPAETKLEPDSHKLPANQEDDEDEFGEDLDFTADMCQPRAETKPGSDCHELPAKQEDGEDEFGEDIDFSADDFDSMAITARPAPIHSAPKPSKEVDVGLDEDDDIDEDLFAAAEAHATQANSSKDTRQPSSRSPSRAKIQRYQIKEVFAGQYTDLRGRKQPEQVVSVLDEETKLMKTITLRESWVDTRCTKDSFVHVIGSFDRHGHCTVNDSEGILILHPDHLISALVVADSYSCMRKAVLQDRVKATGEASAPMLYGTIIHEIFQAALQANRWDEEWLSEKIDELVERHVEDLYKTGLSLHQATDHLRSKLPGLRSWSETFVKAEPDSESTVRDAHGKRVKLSVNKLLDVEEHIWSPMYGLKGNIDATVQVAMDDEDGQRTLTVPLEVKTGKREAASHRAQTALYTLMLSDRYDVSVVYGVLYYVESGQMSRIPAIRHELRHLIMQRNELACYVRERLSLPPMLRNPHTCNNCYAKTPCFLYHKLAEDGNGETSGLRDKFDTLTKHLQGDHQTFFKKWDDLLTKEESEMMRFRRELWTMLSKEREKLGRCFSNVTLIPSSASVDSAASKINRFSYTFKKIEEVAAFSFSESQITVGEPIVVSDENGHYALARGYVTAVARARITVAVDRRLHNVRTKEPGFDSQKNQAFAGIMSLEEPNVTAAAETATSVSYRLDKDEFSNGMALVRNNLVQMMTHDVFQAKRLQSLIVEKRTPVFKPLPSSYTLSGPASQSNINADQRGAIEKILSAEDYALVLGMPGTGKTTTIAHIIRALVAKGKSVLLASYTHTAVDNILLKIRSRDIPVLRLGALAKIHPEVKEFATLAEEPASSTEELHAKWHDPLVVAVTCLGISHPLFQQRIFDYCIVDEASQITLPVCLGPIRMARRFVLVGDHYQLPPLVQNDEAKKGGLDVSLFKELSDTHPHAVATLSEQYRMNEAIMSLSSKLIYGGRLKCGSKEVAHQRLILPHFNALTQLHRSGGSSSAAESTPPSCPSLASPSCLLASTFAPSAPPVIFLNTDPLHPSNTETKHGPRITNTLESAITAQLVAALLAAGQPASSIGVITLYRSQLALIKTDLSATLPHAAAAAVEAHTADKYQGRDKDVILVSLVRANDAADVGDLLRDARRVNVAATRARRKLVFVGSRATLHRGDALLRDLVALCVAGGGLVDMPPAWGHVLGGAGVAPASGTASVREDAVATGHADSNVKVEGMTGVGVRGALRDVPPNKPRNRPNPACKAPRVVRGQRLLAHGALRERPVLADVMREVIGEELSQ